MTAMKYLAISSGTILSILSASVAAPPLFRGLGDLPGGAYESSATAVSADGTTVVGTSKSSANFGNDEGFRWKNNQLIGLGSAFNQTGARRSAATAVSGDGEIVFGITLTSTFVQFNQGFRWTNGVMLCATPDETSLQGAAASGGIWTGRTTYGPNNQAYRSTGSCGTSGGLGVLPGGNIAAYGSYAWGISADGAVVVGHSDSSIGVQAFRWKVDQGMLGLGFVGSARAVSGNGSVVMGYLGSVETTNGWRWTEETGVIPMTGFNPKASNHDGTILVGGAGAAQIWDAVNGYRMIQTELTSKGVNLTGWALSDATGISADGTVIVGTGFNALGQEAWMVDLTPDPITGDIDDDGDVDSTDGNILAAVLVGQDNDAQHIARSNLNGDANLDGLDIVAFVGVAVGP